MTLRSACSIGLLLLLFPVAIFAEATPYPPYPDAASSDSYKVTVDGQPVFVHKFFTYDQFNWMDYASFSMTGKVHVEITCMVSDRKVITCNIRPLAYGIQPKIEGNKVSFDLDQPRYLVIFLQRRAGLLQHRLAVVCRTAGEESGQAGRSGRGQHHGLHRSTTRARPSKPPKSTRLSPTSPPSPAAARCSSPRAFTRRARIVMKSNVRFYVDVDAVILGSTKAADYQPAPALW